MASFFNQIVNQVPIMGFSAPADRELARPIVAAQDTAGRITSIEQIGSIWRRESHLTWLVPDLLAEGSVNLLSGASDVGKMLAPV